MSHNSPSPGLISPTALEQRIQSGIEGPCEVKAKDLTGGGDHWQVRVAAAAFRNLSLVERHQLVYRAVGDWMKEKVHALSIDAVVLDAPPTASKSAATATIATYDPKTIEAKWQNYWIQNRTFKSTIKPGVPKYYILDMFPYPSGNGLHVGHPEGYTATDILARYKRMRGFNVLHPMGWDAFGLPAEQYAVKTGTHPRVTTDKNIETFKRQIISLGFSYDWDREIDTTDEKYYRWTQWIFLQLYKKGLAYESFEPVNWCPELGTVLANEEVVDGKSEVGGYPVIRRPMRQWVLKITEYAERLLTDLDDLDWPEAIKAQQRHWIGKSEGAKIRFALAEHPTDFLEVYSTRPDTLYGATFMVVAPEHPLVAKLTNAACKKECELYVEQAARRSERDRLAETEKTGCFTGGHVLHPVTGKKIPVYVADYVLMGYGTGAIMGVPAHDERDHAFAKKFSLPIVQVISASEVDIEHEAYTGPGILMQSDFLNGLSVTAATEKMIEFLEREKRGERSVQYKLRDWLFSRQRYWGEPIPILHEKNERGEAAKIHALAESELPLVLPELEEFKPTGDGGSPLARAKDWLHVQKNGQSFERETNTMPQWAGSCWYYLRFVDPTNERAAWGADAEKYWMPVDLYVGGAEHAVLHLLYSRFWHKVFYDLGLVSTKEPFQRLVNQGMILGENGEKMSKSRGNVINPDDVIREWGADSMRLYEMFMGPLTATKPWQTKGIAGVHRFLSRVWRMLVDDKADDGRLSGWLQRETTAETHRLLHKTIKKVGEQTEALEFNTAISAMMEWVNAVYKDESLSPEDARKFVLILAPYAPHVAEELWQRLGAKNTLAYEPWPSFDASLCQENTCTYSLQVNGKMRSTLETAMGLTSEDVLAQAKTDPQIAKYLAGKTIVKEIFVVNKIVNFVVRD